MRGRRKQETARNVIINVRFDKDGNDKLNYLCYRTDSSRSDVIRRAVNMYYNLEKSRE